MSSPASPYYAQKSRGFSLIELLIVVGLVAVLSLLIFSGTRSLREKSQFSKCLSNMKQLGVYMQIYLTENNNKLFDDARNTGAGYADGVVGQWTHELRKVAGLNDTFSPAAPVQGAEFPLFICPSDPTKGGWNQYGAKYGIPKDADKSKEGIQARSYLPNRYIMNRRLMSFPDPARTIAFVDFDWTQTGTRSIWPDDARWTNILGDWHGRNINCLFMDLSVRTLPIKNIRVGGDEWHLWNPAFPAPLRVIP